MTKLLVSDDGVTLRDDAMFQYLATCFFPGSPRDIDQAAYIMAREKQNEEEVGAADYSEGQISRSLSNAIVKKYARVSLCGTVAITMCHQEILGKRVSLNSAASIVSEFAYRLGTANIILPSVDGSLIERPMSIPADPADVKKIFREFQSVAHMLAALVVLPNDVGNTHIFRGSPEVVSRILQTATHFQNCLSRYEGAERWKLIDVASVVPACAKTLPAYGPTPELLADIFGTGVAT